MRFPKTKTKIHAATDQTTRIAMLYVYLEVEDALETGVFEGSPTIEVVPQALTPVVNSATIRE